MAYTINKTNGSILIQLDDSKVDQLSTDLTLIGKNVSNYGEVFNENLVHLLENFANSSAPNYPIIGQIWYDTTDSRLKVYDGSGFRTSGGPIVSSTTPSNLIQGDLWINNQKNQLYFYDGTDLLLAGPLYTDEQGISGPEVVSVLDATGNLKHVVKFWVNQTLLGIFSKEEFTPKVAISGFTGIVKKGFNSSTLSGAKFYVTASKADALVSPSGASKTTTSFVSTEASGGNTTMAATLTIQNSTPLVFGPNQNNEVRITNDAFEIVSITSGQNFKIKVKSSGGAVLEAISIDAINQRVGIFKSAPDATLDVSGSAIFSGDLTLTTGNLKTFWATKTSNYTAVNGDRLVIDTTSTPLTVILPASPTVGQSVSFIDGGGNNGFASNSLTISRNGSKINKLTADLTVSTQGAAFTLVYSGSNRGWAYNNVPV
jgi:hypothetical protein